MPLRIGVWRNLNLGVIFLKILVMLFGCLNILFYIVLYIIL